MSRHIRMEVFKSYTLCAGEYRSQSLPLNDGIGITSYEWEIIGSVPDWFEISELGGVMNGYSFTVPDYIVDVELVLRKTSITGAGGIQEDFQILIETDPVCGLTEYDVCCDNACNIAWITRQGGWQNYLFPGVKEWRVEIGDDKTFKTADLEKKYSEISDVYNGKICSTGDIPKSHVDLLDSLQYAIQAFEWNEETENWDIPILIDKKSYVKYKTRDKFFDVKVRFVYAEELTIQTQ